MKGGRKMKNQKSENTEEFKVSGENVMKKVKELVKEGNIRKIIIRNKEDKIIAVFPLTIGVVGTVFLPAVAAIGTIVALVSECTISVEREQIKKEEIAEEDIVE